MINDGDYPYNPRDGVSDSGSIPVPAGAAAVVFPGYLFAEPSGGGEAATTPRPAETKLRLTDYRVSEAARFIESNYAARISIADLTRRANLSRSRLDVLFKNETGMSPLQYLKQTRFRRAAEIFQEKPELRVKEVMAAVGIYNKTYFGSEFKRMVGLTPSEYRAKLRLAASRQLKKQASSNVSG